VDAVGGKFTTASALEGRRKPMSGYGVSDRPQGLMRRGRSADLHVRPCPSVRTSRARIPARGKVRGRRKPARDFDNPMSAAGFVAGPKSPNESGQAALAPLARRSAKHSPRGERTAAQYRRRGSSRDGSVRHGWRAAAGTRTGVRSQDR